MQDREAERAAARAGHAARLQALNARRVAAGYEPLDQFGNWSAIEDRKLTRLVWSMPIIHIAEQF